MRAVVVVVVVVANVGSASPTSTSCAPVIVPPARAGLSIRLPRWIEVVRKRLWPGVWKVEFEFDALRLERSVQGDEMLGDVELSHNEEYASRAEPDPNISLEIPHCGVHLGETGLRVAIKGCGRPGVQEAESAAEGSACFRLIAVAEPLLLEIVEGGAPRKVVSAGGKELGKEAEVGTAERQLIPFFIGICKEKEEPSPSKACACDNIA